MDYKKILKSRRMRIAILRLLSFIPDREMLMLQYRIKTGRKLNLKNPQRFTEKLQWYKLYYRNPLMAKCADKYLVRQYVENLGLSSILNECYGVYDLIVDINFNKLPNQFVMKDTLGSGGNSVIVCKDKASLDMDQVEKQLQYWLDMGQQKVDPGREWVYCQNRHRIIIEKYIESDPAQGGLIDYKFFCFNGRAEFLYVVADRSLGNGAGFGVYTRKYERLDVHRVDERPLERTVEKPDNYDELCKIAEKLAGNFPEVRVDLYDVDGKIIFGELTFFDGSGYMKYEPDTFDYEIGEKFVLNGENHEFGKNSI